MVSPFTKTEFVRSSAVTWRVLPSRRNTRTQGFLLKPAIMCAVLLGLMTGAKAADPVSYEEPTFDPISGAMSLWVGPYLGIETGISQTATDITSGGVSKDVSRVDAAFAVFGGYNWEVSRFVLGVEGGATYLGGYKKAQHATLGQIKTGSRWTANAKFRAGLPINNVMPYLSVGLAVSDHNLKANGKTHSSIQLAPVFGGGLEVAMTNKWRLRADYSLSGIANNKDYYNGPQVKRESANHRLMIGVSRSF